MDATEDVNQKFSMLLPNWLLFMTLCVGIRTFWTIEHSEKMSVPTQEEDGNVAVVE